MINELSSMKNEKSIEAWKVDIADKSKPEMLKF